MRCISLVMRSLQILLTFAVNARIFFFGVITQGAEAFEEKEQTTPYIFAFHVY